MCKQPTARCYNLKCNGFAQTLPLVPCENRPNCELTRPRIRHELRSAETHCPNCRGMSKQERKYLMEKTLKSRKKAEAEKVKAPEGNINGADCSAPVEVEQHGESSRMAESRGAIGGGFAFDHPALTSEETNWAWDLNERHTELVSGSDEMMVDAPANEEDRSANPFPIVTYDSHVPSIPLREHQRLATQSPVPTETTDSFNVELDANQTFEYPSPTRDFSTGPYPIVLRGLPNAPHSSPGPSDLVAENLDPLPWSPAFPQSPVDRPSSPQIPIDPSLLEIDAERVQREMGL